MCFLLGLMFRVKLDCQIFYVNLFDNRLLLKRMNIYIVETKNPWYAY